MKTQLVRSIPPRSKSFAQVMSFFWGASFVLQLVLWTQLLSLGLAKIQICSKNGKMSSDNGSSKEKKFLIENILRPEFGISKNKPAKSGSVSQLEHFSKRTEYSAKKIRQNAGEKIVQNETSLPSWIYCTRYSDRPSCSGEFWGFFSELNFSIAPLINHQKVWEKCFGF